MPRPPRLRFPSILTLPSVLQRSLPTPTTTPSFTFLSDESRSLATWLIYPFLPYAFPTTPNADMPVGLNDFMLACKEKMEEIPAEDVVSYILPHMNTLEDKEVRLSCA